MNENERRRLAAILGMLGSNQAGERDAAAMQAEAFRKKHGLTWSELLSLPPIDHVDRDPPGAKPERPSPRPESRAQQGSPPPGEDTHNDTARSWFEPEYHLLKDVSISGYRWVVSALFAFRAFGLGVIDFSHGVIESIREYPRYWMLVFLSIVIILAFDYASNYLRS